MIFALILLATHLNYFIETPNFKSTTQQEGKKHLHFQNHIQLVAHSKCKGTLYPDLCVSTLSTFPNLETRTMPQIISKVVNHTVHEVKSSSNNCTTIIKNLQNTLNTIEKRALDDCLKLFDDTIVELNTTILDLSKNPSSSSSSSSNQDLQTLLSGAMTNLYTCLDGFSQSKNGNAVRGLIEEKVIEISHHVSNSLAMLKKVKTSLKKEEVSAEYGTMKKGFPSWVSAKDRKLLEGGNVNETKIDVVVAKDGSGNFTTIGEAVAVAPNSTTTRFDMDNDGSLTILELAALLRFLGINPMGNQIHLLWTNMEVNGNGYVELEAAVESVPRPKTMPDLTFDNSNTERLMEIMSEEEKREFGFDVKAIDWKDYITNVHIPGLRRHVMKGRGMGS
nr:pectinesterase 3-like [Arachis hypogaea]